MPKKLSTKEREISEYLFEGLMYKEIASRSKISLNTVKKHASNIYRKLNVKNRMEAFHKSRQIVP
jgi:two-component system, NarL family, response regulator LiaR